jgi:hypothetical protein
MITKEILSDDLANQKIMMPRRIAAVIESLLKQGTVLPEIEECYEIIRDENPVYQHADNSNARKMMTAKTIVKADGKIIRRKIPTTAIIRIIDKLGIASGKYIQGKQLQMFQTQLNTKEDEQNPRNGRKSPKSRRKN